MYVLYVSVLEKTTTQKQGSAYQWEPSPTSEMKYYMKEFASVQHASYTLSESNKAPERSISLGMWQSTDLAICLTGRKLS